MQRRRDPVPGPLSILASFLLALLLLPSAGCSGGDCPEALMYLTVDCTGDDEDTSPTPKPTALASVTCGDAHTCRLETDGTVTCWGSNFSGETQPPDRTFVQIDAGNEITCGVRTDGYGECWGNDYNGQASPPADKMRQIACGDSSCCGIRATDSTLSCWGYVNYEGYQPAPTDIEFSMIDLWDRYACGLTTSGTIRCWGESLGGYSQPPTGAFAEIAVGYKSAYVLDAQGVASRWGAWSNSPPIASLQGVVAGGSYSSQTIACGILTSDRSVTCWGSGTNHGQNTPPLGVPFAQISAGADHVCGVRLDGKTECWGYDAQGQSDPP